MAATTRKFSRTFWISLTGLLIVIVTAAVAYLGPRAADAIDRAEQRRRFWDLVAQYREWGQQQREIYKLQVRFPPPPHPPYTGPRDPYHIMQPEDWQRAEDSIQASLEVSQFTVRVHELRKLADAFPPEKSSAITGAIEDFNRQTIIGPGTEPSEAGLKTSDAFLKLLDDLQKLK